ncbi:hypothetical protein JD969_01100 [Planctomycetota bacterium]|nr:hypothetical protein JD969_01100 [Planctomycetota bacterium]
MKRLYTLALCAFCALLCATNPTNATIYNLPNDVYPVSLNDGDIINLNNGALLSVGFIASTNNTFNMYGGATNASMYFFENSTANIYQGQLLHSSYMRFYDQAVLNMNGGSLNTPFEFHDNTTFNLNGGTLNSNLSLADTSTAYINGGVIDAWLHASSNATLNVTDGTSSDAISNEGLLNFENANFLSIRSNTNGTSNIFSGIIGSLNTDHTSTTNLYGGHITGFISIRSNSTLNLHGGTRNRGINGLNNSTVNVHGTNFTIDGIPLINLSDTPTIITQRGGSILAGTYADGSNFTINLNSSVNGFEDYFVNTATLTVTLIPEPTTLILLTLTTLPLLTRRKHTTS